MKAHRRAGITLLLFLVLTACGSETDQGNEKGERPAWQEETPVDSARSPEQREGIAEDYTNTNRVIWQKPEVVLDLLGDLQDKTVADVGAGTGFFALRMVPLAKKVIALDIDQRFIDYLDSLRTVELPEALQPRLETRLAEADNPHLQPGEADLVIIVNTFMYIKDRTAYLETIKRGIADGGRILIIDFKKKRTPIGPPSEIRVPLYQVEEELYKTGYRNIVANDTVLDYQYVIIAEK